MRLLTVTLSLLIASQAHAARLVCIGDSVTLANQYVQPGDGFCERLGGINAGVGGNTSTQGLERYKRDVLSHDPRYVIIMFGLNDAYRGVPVRTFKANLKRMIKLSGKRRIVLMTPNPWVSDYTTGTKYELNAQLYPYILAIREIARHNKKIRLVDMFALFAEYGLLTDVSRYFVDVLHPNKYGYDFYIMELNGEKGNGK